MADLSRLRGKKERTRNALDRSRPWRGRAHAMREARGGTLVARYALLAASAYVIVGFAFFAEPSIGIAMSLFTDEARP